MANEPNRAEEELKRYAAERRAQAPTEMHGAARRMLQGEVARVYGGTRKGESDGGAWWKRVLLAPKFAWAVSLVAICGISILALREPRKPREEFAAAKESAAPNEQEKLLDLTQRRKDAETQRDEKREVEAKPLADVAVVKVSPASASAPVPVPTVAAPAPEPAGGIRARSVAEAPKKEAQRKVDAVAPVAKAVGAGATLQATSQNEMYFLNSAQPVAVSKDKTAAAKNLEVLNRFKLQEAGRNVVVVDWDGSAYAGSNLSQRAGTNTFLVSGTNRTLNQRVDFRGQYYRVPAPQQALNLQGAQNQAVLNQNQNVQNQIAVDQMRVQGEAVINNSSQVKVDAQAPAQ